MKILVINTGSSSIKYEFFDMSRSSNACLASGAIERIGDEEGPLTHRYINFDGVMDEVKERFKIADHRVGLNRVVELLMDDQYGVIKDTSELSAVGHRVVHGGEAFKEPTLIDDSVIKAIKDNIPLAPLHNPPNLIGIEVAQTLFPHIAQVAVFDTAFHQSLPEHAFLYALPLELYKKHKVRRYGFHGSSHGYVAQMAAERLGKDVFDCNLITIHLGNGASMAAIQNGKSVDTSMGMTPLEGLVMGTRCGNLDPAIPFFLANHLNLSLQDIDTLLNKKSGLKGLCGLNDMRDIFEAAQAGDVNAQNAIDVYVYRVKKYIGAYFAILGRLDAVVFTAGIGERSTVIRQKCLSGLVHLGIEIDERKNNMLEQMEINTDRSPVKVFVIPTNEELKIAKETMEVIKQS